MDRQQPAVAASIRQDWAVRQLPSGTVTFLFTDVEGSTRLLQNLGAERYAETLSEQRRVLRESFTAHGGAEVDTQGDAFFFAFSTAPEALAAARQATERLAPGSMRVRMGMHTGTPLLSEGGYVGEDVHRAARIAAVGHGGQVLVSAATAALVGMGGLRDLGDHRLKDLSAPERIYQLGDATFPPLRSLYRTNLPVPGTPFIGRERELAAVLDLLAGPDRRLVTLSGPGGTGKTRLALQAAGAAADDHPDGVFWVPLEALCDPGLVLESAARALGAEDELAAHIGDKSMLLLFDNFEHLVDAAPELSSLITACPRLRIIVTSREPLHVRGEQEYAVPPLAHREGVDLFVDRARAIDPAFEADGAVSEICRRLDDLPLALELAAARLKALSADEILARLEQRLPLLTGGARDLPDRQRTLRATIEWSHDLLTEHEKRLFARLAVFAGGCTLEAAEQVAGADLDTLQALVEKSLVRHGGDRYWMLETIREYALERLAASGDAEESRVRHAQHFLALAEEARPHLEASDAFMGGWLDRLEAEHDNLRAALDHLHEAGAGELEQRLAEALWRFWQRRGHFVEGRGYLERALAADHRPTRLRAWTTFGAAVLATEVGEMAAGKRLFEEALASFEAHGEASGRARIRGNLGVILMNEHEFEGGRESFERAAREFEELGDERFALLALRNLAWAHFELGDVPRARALHEQVVARARAAGNVHLEANSLGALGEYAALEGRLEEAVPLLTKSTRVFLELRDPTFLAMNLCRVARVLAASGHAEAATTLLGQVEALSDEMGIVMMDRWLVSMNDGTRAMIRDQLDDATYTSARERGKALTPDAAVAFALEMLG
jgi:predicted ATPase/class 3 adenylate cyclase